jgi:ribose 5-phosphate isomerase RpiB
VGQDRRDGARRPPLTDANVLCLSLRSTSEAIAREMLETWLSAEPDPSEAENIARVRALDSGRPIA